MAVDPVVRTAGIHRVPADGEPDQAQRLSAELDAACCHTARDVDAWLAALEGAGPDGSEVARLTERAASARRILDRTRGRAVDEARHDLAEPGAELAIHPATVTERAEALLDARAAHASAQAELDAQERLADEEQAAATDTARRPATADPVAPLRRRRWWDRLRRRRARELDGGHEEAAALLQQVATSTDEVFGARRALVARDDLLARRTSRRDRALEELRVAERAWQDLAGDVPVEEADVVVRRFDPQLEAAQARAERTPGVRAVAVMLEEVEAQLADAERAYGQVPQVVVLAAAAAGRAAEVARAAPAAAVVVIS